MTAINSAHKKGMIHPAEYSAHVERTLQLAQEAARAELPAKRPSLASQVISRITGKKRK